MPTPLTDVDAFTDPINGPADADAQAAAAYNLGFQGLANRTRNNRNRIITLEGRFDANDEVLLSPAVAYTIYIPASAGTDEDPSAPGFSRPDAEYARSETNNARLIFNISPGVLPYAGTLTRIDAIVHPGTARTGTNRMKSILRAVEFGPAGAPSLSVVDMYTSHGSNATQSADFQYLTPESALTPVILNELVGVFLVIVQCGNDAGSNKDKIYGIQLYFTANRLQAI